MSGRSRRLPKGRTLELRSKEWNSLYSGRCQATGLTNVANRRAGGQGIDRMRSWVERGMVRRPEGQLSQKCALLSPEKAVGWLISLESRERGQYSNGSYREVNPVTNLFRRTTGDVGDELGQEGAGPRQGKDICTTATSGSGKETVVMTFSH